MTFVIAVLAPWLALPFGMAAYCEINHRRGREKHNITLSIFGITALISWLPAGFALAAAASMGMLS
jgi:hypothetical protein